MAPDLATYRRAVAAGAVAVTGIVVFYTYVSIDRLVTSRALNRGAQAVKAQSEAIAVVLRALEDSVARSSSRSAVFRDSLINKVDSGIDEVGVAVSQFRRAISVISAVRSAGGQARFASAGQWGRTPCSGERQSFEVKPGTWVYSLVCALPQTTRDVEIAITVNASAIPVDLTDQIALNSEFFCDESTWDINSVERDPGSYGGSARCIPTTNPVKWKLHVDCPEGSERCFGTYAVTISPVEPSKPEP